MTKATKADLEVIIERQKIKIQELASEVGKGFEVNQKLRKSIEMLDAECRKAWSLLDEEKAKRKAQTKRAAASEKLLRLALTDAIRTGLQFAFAKGLVADPLDFEEGQE